MLDLVYVFFFNDTATTEIYTLSLHDALPICRPAGSRRTGGPRRAAPRPRGRPGAHSGDGRRDGGRARPGAAAARPTRGSDRKSTRLNSSHANISYAVFCLKKKKKNTKT